MRKITDSVRQLSRSFSDEGEQLLNPDNTPQDFGVSLSQLRKLAEVDQAASVRTYVQALSQQLVFHKFAFRRTRVRKNCKSWEDYLDSRKRSGQISAQA